MFIRRSLAGAAALAMALALVRVVISGQAAAPTGRNVIIFVADGLRPGSVTPEDMPTLAGLRTSGVEFRNSHSLFPTLTMPNASAIGTGLPLSRTGIFGNTVWLRRPGFETGNFNLAPGTPTPFLENDQVLGDLGDHGEIDALARGNFLAIAAAHGYNTAAIGKIGPTGLQRTSALTPAAGAFALSPDTIVVDDASGTGTGAPLPAEIVARFRTEGLAPEAPARNNGFGAASPFNNGFTGDNTRAGTLAADVVQQQWFADAATRVVLPRFEADREKPFALVFWSRDPDGTQHNQGDSLGTLYPGVNGPTSRAALRNVDRSLAQLLRWLDERPAVKANTDVIVTSDHGFATISRREIDRAGHSTVSESARHEYVDPAGRVDAEPGTLPYGFVAIDLALDLRLNLYDPDERVLVGRAPYKRLRLATASWEHPVAGNGLIGDVVQRLDGADAKVIVAANGGSDLLYVPDQSRETVETIVTDLLAHDYTGAVFVADKYGDVPGALRFSAVGLDGAAGVPAPDIIVAFRVFYFDPQNLQTAVQVADTALQEGQGVHGGIGRESTRNTMIAFGPDFEERYVDDAPASNADLVPTLLHVLGVEGTPRGGRVLVEALRGGAKPAVPDRQRLFSSPADGVGSVLLYQWYDGRLYVDEACRPTTCSTQ